MKSEQPSLTPIVVGLILLAGINTLPAKGDRQEGKVEGYNAIQETPIANHRVALAQKGKPINLIQPNNQRADKDYALALSTANRFLSAWRDRDTDKGLPLLSSRLRKQRSTDELLNYISGTSNPYHTAYEVGRGQRLRDGRYAFEVKLYECVTFPKECFKDSYTSRIVVVEESKGNGYWLVDELPKK